MRSFGATHAIDRSLPQAVLTSQILSALDNIKPSIVYDSISESSTQPVAWEVLAPGGLLCIVLPEIIDIRDDEKKRHVFHLFGSVHQPNLRHFAYVTYAQLHKLLEEGKIKVS